MISVSGFLRVFFQNLKDYGTQSEAYEATELEYEQTYNAGRRYASYDSFRKTKNRVIKNQNG